jgi:hypothetical protein
MLPSEKCVVMAIVERNGGCTLKCLRDLYFAVHVLYPDMKKLRLCVSAALENPHYLDFGVPAGDPGGQVSPELAAAVAAQLPVTHGLATFQLKPPPAKRAMPSLHTWWPSARATAPRSDLLHSWRWR